MSAGPSGDWLTVGPTLEADVSAKLRYHGFSESKWWETVNENREEAQEPTLAVDLIDAGSNRRDEARGYVEKSLKSNDSSKSSDDTTDVVVDNSTNGLTPCPNNKNTHTHTQKNQISVPLGQLLSRLVHKIIAK